MAQTFLQKFTLFIPGKSVQDVKQPDYGTDMRAIERWGLQVAQYLQSVVEQFIGSFHQTPLFTFPSVVAGSPPGANDQVLGQTFDVSITATAGAATVGISGFHKGYGAVVCASGTTGLIYTIQPGSSTLTSLALSVFTDAGSPYTGSGGVSVILVGA